MIKSREVKRKDPEKSKKMEQDEPMIGKKADL